MLEGEPWFGVGGSPRRGRQPRPLIVAAPDVSIFQGVARARQLAWFQVQHARIVLAVADGIVAAISPRTVRQILTDVDLQPQRTRYGKTCRLDEQFQQRAEQVLWCYAKAERLARAGIWVVAVDDKPNHQVLERSPIR